MASGDSGTVAAAGTALADSDTAFVDSDLAAAGSGTAFAVAGTAADSELCLVWPEAGRSGTAPLPRDHWDRAGRKPELRSEKGTSRKTGPQRRLPPDALFPRWKSCSQNDLQMGSDLVPS